MGIAAEPTQWQRVLDLLLDGDWHTEQELAEITRYPRTGSASSLRAATWSSGVPTVICGY
jgi:hypothetical protein